MSLFNRSQRALGDSIAELVPRRPSGTGAVVVTPGTAMRSSAVWACLRLRANLVSTTPLDVFRRLPDGVQIEVPKPPLLLDPEGLGYGLPDWLYSSQVDLDQYGNSIGIIMEVDSRDRPQVVQLASMAGVQVSGKGPVVTKWHINGKSYDPEEIWHERQYTLPGVPLGLSPIAMGAWSIGAYLSAQRFALDWFNAGAFPSGTLRNTEASSLPQTVLQKAKAQFKQAVENRDVFVTGKDWEFNMAQQSAQTAGFLDDMKYGVADIARFLDVPGDMIGAETSTGSITYANIGQRNTQLLVTALGPVYIRRENALSKATSKPTYTKFNTDAVLRLDPVTRSTMLRSDIEGRIRAPREVRELLNLAPFTEADLIEFDRLFPPKNQIPRKGVSPV